MMPTPKDDKHEEGSGSGIDREFEMSALAETMVLVEQSLQRRR